MKKSGIHFPKSPTPAAAACAILSALALAIPSGAIAAHDDYIALKYIYMEGGASSQQTATHYIDTGVVPSGNWSIEASFASTNTAGSSSIYSALFCARGQGNANAFVFWPHVGTSGYEGQTRIDVGDAMVYSHAMEVTRTPIAQCTDYAVAIKESGSGKIAGFLNDTRETDERQQFGSSTCPLVLFSVYTGAADGSYSNVKFSFEGWFYGLKARDGEGNLRLDIVPAKRKSNNEIGVYDRARGLFFTNQVSGASFTAGQANLEIVSVKAYGRNSFEPVVMNNGTVLVEGTDYAYAVATDDDGVKALSVTGIGNYAGATATAVIQSRIDSEDYAELAWVRPLGKVSIRPSYAGGDPIVPRGDWDIEMAFTPEQKTIDNANYSCLLSARLDSTTNGYAIMFWNTASYNVDFGRYGRFDYQGNVGRPKCGTASQGSGTYKNNDDTSTVYADVALASAYGTRHLFALNGGVQYLDGQLVFDGSAGKDFTAGGRLTLFTSSTGETYNTEHSAAGIFHRLSIKDANGVPQLELIPAKRLSNGTIGVYDTVNSKFYPNGDYKSFEAGPEAIRPIASRKPLVISVR